MMAEVQRNQADRRERRDRDERERAEFARDTALAGRLDLADRGRREFNRRRFEWARDSYGTSITCTMMNGRLPTL